jgi:molecular chaperone Hsp33
MQHPTLDVFRALPEDDVVVPFSVATLDLRGRTVRLGNLLDRILRRHDYPEPVSDLVGQAVALTALLGTSVKFDGRFILQVQSDGPVDMLVVDLTTPDRLRAYCRFDAKTVAASARRGTKPEALLGKGHLAMTIDRGVDTSRYQGIVPLDGLPLEEVAHLYFRQSEQIPTRVRLAVGQSFRRHEARSMWRAGGLLVQHLPEGGTRPRDLHPGDTPAGAILPDEDEDEAWVEASSLVSTAEDQELLDPDLPTERLLYRLFHERGVRVFGRQSLVERCRCSRERLALLIRQFTPEERAEMVEHGTITATCEFCNLHYRFDPNEFD